MNIIDNLESDKNHKEHILGMIKMSDELLITSPYLMRDFSLFFKDEILLNIKKINLITTLLPNSLDQIKKVHSLKSLIEIPKIKSREIECNISLNNKLHGKIYIFKKSGKFIGGLISSANFTDSGLWLNHEWGITLSREDKLEELETSIVNSIEPKYKCLSHKSILRLLNRLNSYLNKNGTKKEEEIDLDLTEFLETNETENNKNNSNKTYEFKITEKYRETWQEYFDEFVIFKKKNNEVTVPPDYENYQLYMWYRKQKIFNANDTIPPEHKRKLEKIGFYFGDGHEIRWAKIWEGNYELLEAYYEEYGDSDVPHIRDKEDAFYSLGNWVASQKTYYNNDVLSDYKIEKLNDLEFIWSKELTEFNPINKNWLASYNELKKWANKYGDAHVPQTNPDKTKNKLGKWLNDQRHLKRIGIKRKNGTLRYLEEEREALLLEIGVDFNHKENKDIDSFEKQIQAYLSMKFQYPNLKPPIGTFKAEREVLAQWKFHFNKLPDWKQKRLLNEKIIS
jgi:hypothetical protein